MQSAAFTLGPGQAAFGRGNALWSFGGEARFIESARGDDPHLWSRIRSQLIPGSSARRRVALGTIGFRAEDPAIFLSTEHTERVELEQFQRSLNQTLVTVAGQSRTTREAERPSAAAYGRAVSLALETIANDPALMKVVLGRWVDVTSEPAITGAVLLRALLEQARRAYVYCVPTTSDPLNRRELVGASPELLIAKQGPRISSLPLAGSIPRSTDPAEDARRAAALAESGKDLREHAPVVESIRQSLAPWCSTLDAGQPELISTDTMWHLGTRITGELHRDSAHDGPTASVVQLAQILHPTPAVCGVDQSRAYEVIAELENGARGVMTGLVGWVDSSGDGEFAIALRSAILDGPVARLFAGAGIVDGSDPTAEVLETAAKLQTMLKVVRSL